MNAPSKSEHHVSSFRVLVARVTWFFLGPSAMLISGFKIVELGIGWLTYLDAIFFAAAGVMLLARWYELKSGQGSDGYGHTATLAAFPGFVRSLAPIAIGAWVLVNVLGNHVLN